MNRLLIVAACAFAMVAGGCGAQSFLLGTQGSYLLTATDVLALPGEQVQLRARLQGGDFLRAQEGHVIRFFRGDELFKAAETDEDGLAAVSFKADKPGDYRFVAEAAPGSLSDTPPKPQELLVACRQADTPIAVVDLDKTVVASGFHTVLMGNPAPMARSPEVLQRLARTRTIVFLTHRPDYFGPKSKSWLRDNDYPPGPVLLSTVSGFLKGSGEYKTEMIAQLKSRFSKVEIGIGDKISDVLAYHKNGLKAFLIVQIPKGDDAEDFEELADELKKLPSAIQVVTGWDQVENAIYQGASYPQAETESRLRAMAQALKKKDD